MPDSQSNYDVFVSYAAHDRERIRPLVESLEQAGFDVWWDRRIAPGAGFDSEIQAALDRARCVLVIWSKDSVHSDWVITEASEGLERGILVPIAIDSVRPPLAFRRRQTIDVTASTSASDEVINAVRNVLEGRNVELPRTAGKTRRPWLWVVSVVNLALLLVAATMLWQAFGDDSPSTSTPLVRAPMPLDGWIGSMSLATDESTMQISPQGDTLAFIGVNEDGRRVLLTRHLDQLGSNLLPETEGISSLFFSPDGDWIGFFRGDRLERIPIDGGEPILVASGLDKDFWGASWGPQDDIVYSVGRTGLKSISLQGGDPSTLTELDTARSEGSHRLPHHVTGHDVLLFTIMVEGTFKHEIWALNINTGERTYLVDGIAPSYVSPGYVLFSKGEGSDRGSLWAAPFDAKNMVITESPQLVQSSVSGDRGFGFTASFDGPLVYLPSQGVRRARLVLLEEGRDPRIIAEASWFERPAISHDGQSVAVARRTDLSRPPQIWIYNLGSGGGSQFTEAGRNPLWDLDDKAISFMETGVGIVNERVDDSKSRHTLVHHPQMIMPTQWINAGKSLIYTAINPETGGDTYILETGGQTRRLYSQGAHAGGTTPDEHWLALCTWPRGILVGKLPNFSPISLASSDGCHPQWSSDGSKLYYSDYDKLWVVNAKSTNSSVLFGERQIVADLGLPGYMPYDIDDRGRIVIVEGSYDSPKPPVLLLNWRQLLEEN